MVIAPDVPLELAVERLIFGKSLNAGQICVAPDYVLLPEEKIEEFISLFKQKYRTLYPHGITGQDFASIINQRQFDCLYHLLQDAETQGAKIHPCHEPAMNPEGRRLAPHLITNVSDQMAVMEQEIFGPLLPLIPYQSQQQAIEFINQRPRPLALYVMSSIPLGNKLLFITPIQVVLPLMIPCSMWQQMTHLLAGLALQEWDIITVMKDS